MKGDPVAIAEITEIIQTGTPVEQRGIVIVPLFPRRQPVAEYVTIDAAIPLGFRVEEVDADGTVPELRAINPLQNNVLLYDGEELLGAKQNRILNLTVLLGADSDTLIPVTCVEQGRWSKQSNAFRPAAHASYPQLRRLKNQRLSAAPLARGAAQQAVWEEVSDRANALGTRSATGAQADIYAQHEEPIQALAASFPLHPGQCGAILALGNAITLDWVSQPQAWSQLYPRLLRGYLLDGLAHLDRSAACADEVAVFLPKISAAATSRRAAPGLGDDLRLANDKLVGSALELEGELIQLCAFSTNPTEPRHRPIARPSQRR
jgi:hypothetical protein